MHLDYSSTTGIMIAYEVVQSVTDFIKITFIQLAKLNLIETKNSKVTYYSKTSFVLQSTAIHN